MAFSFRALLQATNTPFKGNLCRCPNGAAHKHGDAHVSCLWSEGKNGSKPNFTCLACHIKGSRFDFLAWSLGLQGYPGNEAAVNEHLQSLGLLERGAGIRQQMTKLHDRVTWLPFLPSVMERFHLSFRDVLLFGRIVMFVQMNSQRYNRADWTCSMRKLREKFLPGLFSASTLVRSVNRLEAADLISHVTNKRTTVWRVNFSTLESQTDIDDKTFQNDTSEAGKSAEAPVPPEREAGEAPEDNSLDIRFVDEVARQYDTSVDSFWNVRLRERLSAELPGAEPLSDQDANTIILFDKTFRACNLKFSPPSPQRPCGITLTSDPVEACKRFSAAWRSHRRAQR
jgi:hypothetical protein